ncbi:hypothetical protein FOMPIDRAFT_122351 [Fomitopsis schrenkii]|uniref:Uncharacterized protein n=1 Tax=Fomitopsis schrenkii TaxID=2126942 RepID=S8EG60_FOMSC|nr:hypothetical protein FOMPIDRAFT_122351 [Fomitopsis schrenkii]
MNYTRTMKSLLRIGTSQRSPSVTCHRTSQDFSIEGGAPDFRTRHMHDLETSQYLIPREMHVECMTQRREAQVARNRRKQGTSMTRRSTG